MKHRTLRAALTAAVLVGASLPAAAQSTPWEDRGFANLSFGMDSGTSTFDQTRAFVIYNETGTAQSSSEFGSFAIVDVTLGARVWRNLGVAIGYHMGETKGSGSVTGSAPHPLFFDRPRTFSSTYDNAERNEHAANLHIGWMVPVNDNFDLFIYGGPSFFRIKQDLVTNVTLTEQGPPYTTVNVQPTLETVKRNETGYNLGVDATYIFYTTDSVRLGVGGFLRFTGATATLTTGSTNVETDLGGLQYAAGARIRF